MSNTLPSFNPGDRVKLIGHPDTATATEVLDRCEEPGCWLPALWVRRDPGSFAGWSQDQGLWHQEDTEFVVDVNVDDRPSYRAEFLADVDTSSEDAATNALRLSQRSGSRPAWTEPTCSCRMPTPATWSPRRRGGR